MSLKPPRRGIHIRPIAMLTYLSHQTRLAQTGLADDEDNAAVPIR